MLKHGLWLLPAALVGAWFFWPKAPETPRAGETPSVKQAAETPGLLPPNFPNLPPPPAFRDPAGNAGAIAPPLILTSSTTSLPDLPPPPQPLPPSIPTTPAAPDVNIPSPSELPLPPLPPLPPPLPGGKQ